MEHSLNYEDSPVRESHDEANQRTLTEMRQKLSKFTIADIEGIFKRFNKGDLDDEI